MDLILKNVRACDPQTGLDKVVDIGIKDGIIAEIGSIDKCADRIIDGEGRR